MTIEENISRTNDFATPSVEDVSALAPEVHIDHAEEEAFADFRAAVSDSFEDVIAAARQLIRDKPLAALGAAAGAAYLLARLRR
jgi:hypothetical protein